MRVIHLTTAVALVLASAHASAVDKLKLQLDWMPNGGDTVSYTHLTLPTSDLV